MSDQTRRESLPQEAQEFLNYAEVTFKKTTISTYTTSLRKFYDFLKKKYPEHGQDERYFKKIDRSLLEEWFRDLYRCGLGPASRFLCLMNIRCYLSWAYDRSYMDQDPRGMILARDFPKKPDYLPKPIEPEHDKKLQQFLRTSKNITEKGLLLLRYTGIRVGDLLTLPCDCLHQEEDGSYSIKVPLGKLNRERFVPLTPECTQLVRELQYMTTSDKYTWEKTPCLECEHIRYVKVKLEKDSKNLPLMANRTGIALSYSAMRSAMDRVCENADIPYYSVHQLRHTFATSLLNAGASLSTIMKLLGHRRITMTLRYATVTQETIRKEYYAAIEKTKEQYEITTAAEQQLTNPLSSIEDLIKIIEKKRQENIKPQEDKKKLALLKRLKRLENDLKEIL